MTTSLNPEGPQQQGDELLEEPLKTSGRSAIMQIPSIHPVAAEERMKMSSQPRQEQIRRIPKIEQYQAERPEEDPTAEVPRQEQEARGLDEQKKGGLMMPAHASIEASGSVGGASEGKSWSEV
jgi:hypothetical protein